MLIGPSGSGKTTKAKEILNSNFNTIMVSRDAFRTALWALEPSEHSEYYEYPYMYVNEEIVSDAIVATLKSALKNEKDVIIDATNLKMKYIRMMADMGFEPEMRVMGTSVDQCIENDQGRERVVGENIIRRQFKQLDSLLKNPEFQELLNKYGI